jgi:acetyl esterase
LLREEGVEAATGEVRVESCTYRTVDGIPLEARLLLPQVAAIPRAAMAYFHPGAWRAGGPMLIHELRHLASRGMVVAAFGYRLLPDRHRPARERTGYASRWDAAKSIHDCVADAQAAIRWLRARAEVDAKRVVAAGYSSGAHLAAATALLPAMEASRTSCRPNALVLYGGVFDLGVAELSPLQHIGAKAPPALVLCGERDSLAKQSRQLAQAMSDAGNRCELAMFPGGHQTFTSQFSNPVFASSLASVDRFLVSLGHIDEVGDLDQRIAALATTAPKRRRKPTTSA